MKNKNTLLVIVLVFVLLLGGAYVLYDRLGKEVTAEQMIVHSTPVSTAEPTEEEALPENGPTVEPESAEHEEPEDILALDFHVYDKAGNTVHLSDFFGKPIVLNFWASWCGPCQSEMPDFNEKYAELGGDVHFVMVNMTDGRRETVETASAFIEKNSYDFPVFYDTSGEAAATYGAYSLPTSFFINSEGHVIAQAVGAIDAATLQRGIDMIEN
ncbi:MAG: TlpA family protein disulfide reductase [Clostridia bacterium]|nr:TlpA family protein disulfide reductase [Clostridia bacterium]